MGALTEDDAMTLRGWMIGWMVLGLGCLRGAPVSAADAQDILPARIAFQVEAVRGTDGVGYVTFTIAPGYALYRDKILISSPDAALRFVNLPHGVVEHDDYLGDREQWRSRAIATVGLPGSAHGSVRLQIHLQGCADLGVCFNPETRVLTLP